MPRILESSVQRIKDAASIVDVVGDFIELKKKGAGYWACCPFHGERTPSFYVNPARNTYHCFGCEAGSTPVDFLMNYRKMSFTEAIEYLGKRFNEEVRYAAKEWTDEEREEQRHRESLFIAVQAVQRFFVEQLQADTPEAQVAREYAYGRWSEDFCKEFGIGYAPKGNQAFFDFIKRNCINEELLVELGYIGKNADTGSTYAFFRERITIPIFSRSGKLVGFSGRYNGSNQDISRYMNSRESTLFKKHEIVFGLRDAVSMARKNDRMILVEGGPDVLRLHLLGITNAVGALGVAWGESHFRQIAPITKNICFIPDTEPPKGDKQFGAGFEAVFRAGTIAVKLGLDVTVKEIPVNDPKEKQDPDSYISDKNKFSQLREELFILWYADKLLKREGLTKACQKRAVEEIADLLAYVDDKLTRSQIMDALPDIYGKPKMWKEALKAGAVRRKKDAEDEASDALSYKERMMRRAGIICSNGCYFTAGKDDQLQRFTNFTLDPIAHVRVDGDATRVFKIKNEFDYEDSIEFTSDELVSIQKLNKALEKLGPFVWSGNIEQLNKLKEYLYMITHTCDRIKTLGWNEEYKLYALGNGIFVDGQWREVDELGMVNYGGKYFYLPAFSEMHRKNKTSFAFARTFIHKPDTDIALRDFVGRVMEVFGQNAMSCFTFVLASLFRDIIYPVKDAFPILNLYGPPSSGKTALGNSFMALLYPVVEPSKLATTTIASLNTMLGRASNIPVIIDEYKNSVNDTKIEMLKSVWGGKGQSKKNIETKEIEETMFTCSLILCGQEQTTKDSALFNRIIYLKSPRTEFSVEEKKRYRELKELTHKRMSHLLLELLKLRPAFENNYADNFGICTDEMLARLGTISINDRIFDNWVTLLAAFRTAETYIDVPFTYKDFFDFSLSGMIAQNAEVRQKSELSDFWKLFASLFMSGKIMERAHFRIKYETSFKPCSKKPEVNFEERRPIVYVNFDAVKQVMARNLNSGGTSSRIDPFSIEGMLEISRHYLGNKQCRFINLNARGELDEHYDNENKRSYSLGGKITAWCFDYTALKDEFDINLESIRISDADLLAEDTETETPSPPPSHQPSIFDSDSADDEDMPF